MQSELLIRAVCWLFGPGTDLNRVMCRTRNGFRRCAPAAGPRNREQHGATIWMHRPTPIGGTNRASARPSVAVKYARVRRWRVPSLMRNGC